MLRLVTRILDALSFDAPVVACEPDPLDDPAFRGMSRRDLADLPRPRAAPRAGGADALGAGGAPPLEPHEIRPAA